jgi:hypothetical protein
MYHVTLASDIASILVSGLEPRIGERSEAFGETRPAVYAFPTIIDCHTALSQWLGEWFCDKEEDEGMEIHLVIVEFDPSGLAQLQQEVEFEARFAATVPPTAIRALHSEYEFGKRAYAAHLADVA